MNKISVVIPTFHHLDSLKSCIDGIIKHTDLEALDVKVIVVANGCYYDEPDGTQDYIKGLGKRFVLLDFKQPLGYTIATNIGVKYAIGVHKSDTIVLLNNDAVPIGNEWLTTLIKPFQDPKVGLTGPTKLYNEITGRKFLLFYCTAIRKEVFDKIGLLEEQFNPGYMDDTEFCARAEEAGYTLAQVPHEDAAHVENGVWVSSYPMNHTAEVTMHDPDCMPNWDEVKARNVEILRKKYPPRKDLQNRVGNVIERCAHTSKTIIINSELTRGKFVAKLVKPKDRVLDLCCSTGYLMRFLPDDVEYTGYDIDDEVLEFARKEFPKGNFVKFDLETQPVEGFWDTIVALESLEHLSNGVELAQELKKHCNKLIVSVPCNEKAGSNGFHKLSGLTDKDFPDFDYRYIVRNHYIQNEDNGWATLLMTWPKEPKVLAAIPTKGRYFTTLPMAIVSVINQTRKPDYIIIADDNIHEEFIALQDDPTYKPLFQWMTREGIGCWIAYGPKKGLAYNNQMVQEFAIANGYDLVMRCDDDCVLEPNTLETLLKYITPDVGAVGCPILVPGDTPITNTSFCFNVDKVGDLPNAQWAEGVPEREVEHLHCSFLYRPGIAKYNLNLSPLSMTEETQLTHEIYRAGYKIIYTPKTKIWHLKQSSGGCRNYDQQQMYAHDRAVFDKKLSEWKGISTPFEVYLDNGIGDHVAFSDLIPELLEQHQKIRIACCYPDVFHQWKDNQNISIVSILASPVNADDYNIYQKMIDWDWKGNLIGAFRKLYLG